MKKIILVSVVILSVVALFTANAGNSAANSNSATSSVAKVEVYYFHFTRRCVTCQAVETESQKAIAAL